MPKVKYNMLEHYLFYGTDELKVKSLVGGSVTIKIFKWCQ